MSYDIYCYPSLLGKPDLDEARALIEAEEESTSDARPEIKVKIAKALLAYNPRLESFNFDFPEIAGLTEKSIEEIKEAYEHIELNTPEGDLATQITLFDSYVTISVPYWYSGENAKALFDKISDYVKIIKQSGGYFVYDPQTEFVFDPLIENGLDLEAYQSVTQKLKNMESEQSKPIVKSPWWKFW